VKIAHALCALSLLLGPGADPAAFAVPIIVDHNDTDLRALSPSGLATAKTKLHIAYGHTSHGSQLTYGMSALVGFINGGGLGLSYPQNFFAWNNGGTAGALDLHDYFQPGDLGNPDYTTWATETRGYLTDPVNADVNVVIWSWCGQADTTAANIDLYLNTMNQLEQDYPSVSFVYMTGHVNGCAPGGNLLQRNQQIRDYCTANGKILYDFADIESWDPDGNYYGDKLVTDACSYDSDGNGTRDRNWAIDWQNTHTMGVDWYDSWAAHSQPLNGNRKAYAAWALWSKIAAGEPATLVWTGSIDGKWDTDKTANWSGSGAACGYREGDHVVFGDTGAHTLSINITTTVSPGSVLVNNDAVNYVLGGAGSIAGPCGLTKKGIGTLTLATGNAYTGETRINAGAVIVAAEGALGASAVRLGDTTGSTDAALLVAGAFTVDRSITVQDDGSGSSSRTLGGTNASGTVVFSGGITLQKGLTLTAASGGVVRLAGALDNSEGNTITKIGDGTVVLDAAQTHGPGATLRVEGGEVNLNSDAGTGALFNLTVSVGNTGTANFGATQHLAGLHLQGGTAQQTAGGNRVLVTQGLTVDPAAAKLDITDNDIIVHYTGGAPYVPSPALESIKQWIAAGYAGTSWGGKGIISSAAAADPISLGVGYAQNDMLFLPYDEFAGEPVDLSTVLVKFTYNGDVNLDGCVDDNDVTFINLFYDGGATDTHYWHEGDISGYDGRVDDNDVTILGLTYGLGVGHPLGGAVPEPTTLALAALGGLGILLRRRK